MKKSKNKNRTKGSVLVAVIGILAILAVMALRFNVEMETAMIKTNGKNLASDVKVLANSGLMYCISQLLKNGKNWSDKNSKIFDHNQLAIEEELEMQIKSNNEFTPLAFHRIKMGCGAPFFGAEKYSAFNFYDNKNNLGSSTDIPIEKSLAPGDINFMIEDLSGKLPIGHVSQWFQRHLISSILVKLVTNKVPIVASYNKYNDFYVNVDIFESSNYIEKDYDNNGGHSFYLRSLIPYEMAKIKTLKTSFLDVAGLPLTDGMIAQEELGSTYTWTKFKRNESEKKHATDFPRSTKDYILLSSALTPFSRFYHETRFTDRSTEPNKDFPVTYAAINPMVMYRQNERLYYSLFNYEVIDKYLRMYFSVSFNPGARELGVYATDDNANKIAAIVAPRFFADNVDGNIINSGMCTQIKDTFSVAYCAVSTPLLYNARDDASDLHPIPKAPFDVGEAKQEKLKLWGDAEFIVKPEIENVYYIAMDKAIKRLSRAFKGTMIHELPAENMMCPIMTRKTLEFAIIKAVFGNSILFANDNKLISAGGFIDYLSLFEAIQNGKIDLSKIKFIENAFSKFSENEMAEKYFVPYWQHYDEHLKYTDKYLAPNEIAKDIKVPAFGFYIDGSEYINYLPHPQTDQRALNQLYVTVAAAFSVEKKAKLELEKSGAELDIRKLYLEETEKGKSARNLADTADAFLDLSTPPPYEISEESTLPGDKYVKLFNVDHAKINFKPADFSPYETKVRMAVLVNLLNAIIPAKITPSKNVKGDPDDTLFSKTAKTLPHNLKGYLYFENGQYWVNNKEDATNPTGLPKYLNGWTGGIRTPGMTFWKYGVNSTTFQCTVDAYKYDDSARLTTVLTFDSYDDSYDSSKNYNTQNPETKNRHSQSKYELTQAQKLNPSVISTIYLNPKSRADPKADNYVIGNGMMRYPTDTNTDSWRILSSVWSSTFGRNNQVCNDYFNPLYLYPQNVLNVGPDGGSWHFEPHSYSDNFAFNKFFKNIEGESSLFYSAQKSNGEIDFDYSTGQPLKRKYSFGKNSWMQWQGKFTKTMAANSVQVLVYRDIGFDTQEYTMEHLLTFTEKNTAKIIFSQKFSTVSGIKAIPLVTFLINVKVQEGEYEIRLTELTDSNPRLNAAEKITKILILGKKLENGLYTH